MYKTFFRIFLGILTIIATTILVILLFTEVIEIKNAQVLKWLPLLICFIGFYFAGLINRKTNLALTPILLIALVVFIPLELLYFPFLFMIILFSLLSILVSRTDLSNKIKIPLFIGQIIVFGIYLFSQPLIIKNKGYGTDAANNLFNATVLWDFTSNTPLSLPKEVFKDINGNQVSLKDFDGKTLYVTFWATWCGYCLGEKPELEKLKKLYQDNSDIVFIDISLDSTIETWKAYLLKNEQNGIQLITSNEAKTRSNYQFSGIPYHIIVDSKGNYKECQGPYFIDKELLSNQDKVTEYINTPYKVFKTSKTNGKETVVRVR
ncbi:MAG: TlpA family protein disulfide reductase [Mongoliitalea sp.]